jgi:hypothetical protein
VFRITLVAKVWGFQVFPAVTVLVVLVVIVMDSPVNVADAPQNQFTCYVQSLHHFLVSRNISVGIHCPRSAWVLSFIIHWVVHRIGGYSINACHLLFRILLTSNFHPSLWGLLRQVIWLAWLLYSTTLHHLLVGPVLCLHIQRLLILLSSLWCCRSGAGSSR